MAEGTLARYAGGPFLRVILNGVDLDTDHVGPVTIHQGRRSPDERPSAPTVAFAVHAEAVTVPELGAPLSIVLTSAFGLALMDEVGGGFISTANRTRFTGTVTDVAIRPHAGVVGIVGAGNRARAARIPIGSAPWPAELDGPRAYRILQALALEASGGFNFATPDPGTVTVVARDIDSQPAGALLDELAAYTGGDAWETRNGYLIWRDARSRSATTPALTLSANNVLVDPEFTKSLDGLVTRLTVAYGTAEPKAEFSIEDTTAPIEVLGARVDTPLATAEDAQAYATQTVGRRSRPRWRVPDLPLDVMRSLDPAQRIAFLGIEAGALVALTGMPTPVPFAASHLWVEGWTELFTRHDWRLNLSVSPRGLTGASARWVDVPATYVPAGGLDPAQPLRWTSPPFAGLSWIGTAGWWTAEAPTSGRWADVPASTKWSNYPTATDWGDLP